MILLCFLFNVDCPDDIASQGSLSIKGKSDLYRLFFNGLFLTICFLTICFLTKGTNRQKPPPLNLPLEKGEASFAAYFGVDLTRQPKICIQRQVIDSASLLGTLLPKCKRR